MTRLTQIAWDDTVLPFQLDRSDIRGRVARLDGVLDRVLAQHNYPAVVEALVAEAALLTALIGQTIKLRWKLSLQIRGDGPVRIIATDYYAPSSEGGSARMRAWASFDADRLDRDGPGFPQVGKGYLAILLDQGTGTTPYQGITPIAGSSLSACAETYFAQSEQLPTRFALSFGRSTLPGGPERWRAGGVMLQHMPKASPFVANDGGSGEGGLLAPTDNIGDAAGDLRNLDALGEERERDRLGVGRLHLEARPVDAAPVEPRRGAGLEPAHAKAKAVEPIRKADRRRLADSAGRNPLLADMDDALEESAGGEDDRPRAVFIAGGVANAENPLSGILPPPLSKGGLGGSCFT